MAANLQHVAVIGAGTMGAGIAQAAAAAGFDVTLVDTSPPALAGAVKRIDESLARLVRKGALPVQEQEAALKRIRPSGELAPAAEAAIAIEAVYEDEAVKRETWSKLGAVCAPGALLASNTSSISITVLAGASGRAERFIGLHFFNPVPLMKLVEVIRGNRTSETTRAEALEFARKLGKTPIETRDYPGFVSNRVLMPLINEAIFALEEGVATAEAIDEIFKLGMAHPMGPLTLADFIGLDVCLNIMEVLQRGFGDPKYRPCPLLRQMVAAGKLGRKSGEGFYRYQGS